MQVLQHQPGQPEDMEFGNRAYDHVINLCGYGVRVAGSSAEEQTIHYISKCFTDIGMAVNIESFEFTTFLSVNREMLLNGNQLFFRSLFFNSFQLRNQVEGECFIADCDAVDKKSDYREKIVFTDRINDVLYLKENNPEAVVVVRQEDLGTLRKFSERKISISVPGKCQDKPTRTYNVIAEYLHTGKRPGRDIVVNAHWDSRSGPGAKDNASGVATIVELARGFKGSSEITPYNLKFIATGAEECGFLGSLAHIVNHSASVRKCDLAITVDGVGDGTEGTGKPYLSMTPPGCSWERKVDTASRLHLVSTDNWQSAWFVSGDDLYWNSPTVNEDWISEKVTRALDAKGIEFVKGACCSGTDERSFAFMGIPTIQQSYMADNSRDIHHTQEDVPNENFRHSLNIAGRVTSRIIMTMIENRKADDLS